jgi:hypothetical protein
MPALGVAWAEEQELIGAIAIVREQVQSVHGQAN